MIAGVLFAGPGARSKDGLIEIDPRAAHVSCLAELLKIYNLAELHQWFHTADS